MIIGFRARAMIEERGEKKGEERKKIQSRHCTAGIERPPAGLLRAACVCLCVCFKNFNYICVSAATTSLMWTGGGSSRSPRGPKVLITLWLLFGALASGVFEESVCFSNGFFGTGGIETRRDGTHSEFRFCRHQCAIHLRVRGTVI